MEKCSFSSTAVVRILRKRRRRREDARWTCQPDLPSSDLSSTVGWRMKSTSASPGALQHFKLQIMYSLLWCYYSSGNWRRVSWTWQRSKTRACSGLVSCCVHFVCTWTKRRLISRILSSTPHAKTATLAPTLSTTITSKRGQSTIEDLFSMAPSRVRTVLVHNSCSRYQTGGFLHWVRYMCRDVF